MEIFFLAFYFYLFSWPSVELARDLLGDVFKVCFGGHLLADPRQQFLLLFLPLCLLLSFLLLPHLSCILHIHHFYCWFWWWDWIQVFRSSPPSLIVLIDLLIDDALVFFRRQHVYLFQELPALLEEIIGSFGLKVSILLRIMIQEHLDQSAMIDDVDLGFGEVKSVQLIGLVVFNVKSFQLGGVIGKETVSQLLADQFFPSAVSHDPAEDLFVQIHCAGSTLNDFISHLFVVAFPVTKL